MLVGDFDRHNFDSSGSFFARIGGGSLGGKARGLAFSRYLLNYHGVSRRFPGIRIGVPPAVVLGTDCFDQFLAENRLLDVALGGHDDREITRRFLAAPLPDAVILDLTAFLEAVRWPLAVRSSSLLEDSQHHPFTGVYDTFMLANNHPDLDERLAELMQAVKRVYASTFAESTRAYLRATPYRLEEEKMAVILQRVVGTPHVNRYYPDFSGVARSHNFYPAPPLKSEDGVAAVALGLGRTVVEGGEVPCLFSPRYPRHIAHFSSVDDILANSQRTFWALELDRGGTGPESSMRESRFGLEIAEADGTLFALGSTYSEENHAIFDGLSRPGVRLVTFAPVLKHGLFPLAEILDLLLEVGRRGMNRPTEIEFAVRLSKRPDSHHEFGFLQMRPLVLTRETEELNVNEVRRGIPAVPDTAVLGNGKVSSKIW